MREKLAQHSIQPQKGDSIPSGRSVGTVVAMSSDEFSTTDAMKD